MLQGDVFICGKYDQRLKKITNLQMVMTVATEIVGEYRAGKEIEASSTLYVLGDRTIEDGLVVKYQLKPLKK